MPSWTLQCPECQSVFEHARIDDTRIEDYLLPVKPVFPVLGLEIKCARCGLAATYQQSDLSYRA
jgi:endogenous inhibitor of DNA gyrase (YacG/DUF329 family)